jgi:hypothetical protein
MGTGSFPGRGFDHTPHLAPRLKKEKGYTSTLPLGLRGLFRGELHHLYVFIYFTTSAMGYEAYGRDSRDSAVGIVTKVRVGRSAFESLKG